MKIDIRLITLFLSCCSGFKFIEDPKCPPVTPKSPAQCKGQRSNCWSPGVRDLDCPASGLCCYDGCANTCVSSSPPPPPPRAPTTRKPRPRPPPTTRRPVQPPPSSYIPVPPPEEVYQPPPPLYLPPPETTPPPVYNPPPVPVIAEPSNEIEIRQPPVSATTCPPASPLTADQCRGRHSTCWSVGVPDLDCPDWGLCCFDGCANTCAGQRDPEPIPSYQPPAPRRNPCDPNPCGPGSMCIPQEGEPTCKCPEGMIPNPTPQQGCIVPNPCDPNPCGRDAMCIPQEGRPFCKCPEGLVPDPSPEIQCSRPDPCDPSPCGPGTTCSPNIDGNPICRCLPGLVPKPDTITGCGPECVIDPDCEYGHVCRNQKCVERPDPCNPSPCGPGTTCTANSDGNPICRCLPGLVPKPDTITGCGPECVIDPDCQYGYICQQQKCIEKPDPCDPNPCGPGAEARPLGDTCQCTCPPGTVGDGQTGCNRGECLVDDDCHVSKACDNYFCVDPCQTGTCRATDFCRVMNHRPICGFNYEAPPQEARDPFVIGEKYNPAREPSQPDRHVVIGGRDNPSPTSPARNPFVIGGEYVEDNPQNCVGGRGCGVPEQRTPDPQMMMMMDTSNLPVIGIGRNKRNLKIIRRVRKHGRQ